MRKIRLKVDALRIEKKISKNKLAQRAEMERTQLNKYLNNEVRLIDLNVLSRLCEALQCENISDILEIINDEIE